MYLNASRSYSTRPAGFIIDSSKKYSVVARAWSFAIANLSKVAEKTSHSEREKYIKSRCTRLSWKKESSIKIKAEKMNKKIFIFIFIIYIYIFFCFHYYYYFTVRSKTQIQFIIWQELIDFKVNYSFVVRFAYCLEDRIYLFFLITTKEQKTFYVCLFVCLFIYLIICNHVYL